jgi:hypothetical protein
MSDISRSKTTDAITAAPFHDVETAIAETTRVIAALRDRWPKLTTRNHSKTRCAISRTASPQECLGCSSRRQRTWSRIVSRRSGSATGETWSIDDDDEDAG